MSITTFERLINILVKSFMNFKFNQKDDELVEVWFNELSYMDDAKAVLAVKKVIASCDFVTIKNIKEAYGQIENPSDVDTEEGWGLVERAIRRFGYMRSGEALDSLPVQVQKAVMFMGGFQSICEAENKEVIRGQFNKAMSAVNTRTRSNATLGEPLLNQINTYKQISNSTIPEKLTYNHEEYNENCDRKIENNKTSIAHIRDIINASVNNRVLA